jgi:hypothetical protein
VHSISARACTHTHKKKVWILSSRALGWHDSLTEELVEGFKVCIFRTLTAKATGPRLLEGWIPIFSRNFQQLLSIQFLLYSYALGVHFSGCTGTLHVYLHLQVPTMIFKALADPWLAWICSRPKDPRLAWNLCTHTLFAWTTFQSRNNVFSHKKSA